MVLQFTIDPQTGVYKPPVTVFNGGAAKRSLGGKRKTRKGRKGKKTRKATTYRRRR
jgi:hypothetical protein